MVSSVNVAVQLGTLATVLIFGLRISAQAGSTMEQVARHQSDLIQHDADLRTLQASITTLSVTLAGFAGNSEQDRAGLHRELASVIERLKNLERTSP